MSSGDDDIKSVIYRNELFNDPETLFELLEDSVFWYSAFSRFAINEGHMTSVFLSCTFSNVDWYSGLFNLCTFVEWQFEDCTFRGTGFPGCRFVDCRFARCQFLPDNLGGECYFDEVKWYGCKQSDCGGLPSAVPEVRPKGR